MYFDGNPLTRRDDNGKMWLVAAAAFAVGTVASVATQMMGGKSFKEVSWIGAVTSGLTTAMGLLGVAPCKQPLSADSRAAFPGQSGPY